MATREILKCQTYGTGYTIWGTGSPPGVGGCAAAGVWCWGRGGGALPSCKGGSSRLEWGTGGSSLGIEEPGAESRTACLEERSRAELAALPHSHCAGSRISRHSSSNTLESIYLGSLARRAELAALPHSHCAGSRISRHSSSNTLESIYLGSLARHCARSVSF